MTASCLANFSHLKRASYTTLSHLSIACSPLRVLLWHAAGVFPQEQQCWQARCNLCGDPNEKQEIESALDTEVHLKNMQDEMIFGNIAYTTIWLCGILESTLWFVEMIHVILLKLPITRDNRPSFSDNARAVCLPSPVLILTFIDLFNGQHSGNEPLHRLFASKACMYGCIVSTPHFVAWPFSVLENWRHANGMHSSLFDAKDRALANPASLGYRSGPVRAVWADFHGSSCIWGFRWTRILLEIQRL